MDTGLVLQLRAALDLVAADLGKLSDAQAALVRNHARTPLAGRTWLQQATPVTLGLKAAGWLSAVERHRVRIAELRPRIAVVQFGGAAGTLASLGEQGTRRRRGPRAGTRTRAARPAVAHAARPHRGGRDDARAHRRHAGQDRARRVAADADRSRRSVRAGRGRPRRIVDDAAQAQSGQCGGAYCPRRCACRRSYRSCSRRWCRSTSAAWAAGTPSGTRCRRSACSRGCARAHGHDDRPASRSMRRAWRRISTSRAASSLPSR